MRVVVTGIGIVSPIGIGTESYWRSLIEGRSNFHVRTFSFPSGESFHRLTASTPPLPAALEESFDRKAWNRTGRATRLALLATQLALEDAQFSPSDLPALSEEILVIIGTCFGCIEVFLDTERGARSPTPRAISPFLIPTSMLNAPAAEVSLHWKFRGAGFGTASACATSAHAVGIAVELLRRGHARVAVAGGTEAALHPILLAGFDRLKALSRNQEPAGPFDQHSDGFIPAEGAGILVLETEAHARARGVSIYGEIAGIGFSSDAYHITAPCPQGAVQAMRRALRQAGLKPEDIGYINAHGSGTPLNDRTETEAIKEVFGDRAYEVPISSTKSQVGHALGAAGALEIAATLLALRAQVIPPTAHLREPRPGCDLDYVPERPRPVRFQTALKNAFGFGGQNIALVLRSFAS